MEPGTLWFVGKCSTDCAMQEVLNIVPLKSTQHFLTLIKVLITLKSNALAETQHNFSHLQKRMSLCP